MSIQIQIDRALAKRKLTVKRVEAEIGKQDSRLRQVKQAEAERLRLLQSSGHIPELSALLAKCSLESLIQAIELQISGLQVLYQRFKRGTLNIALAGPARTGKSTVIQVITGLGNDKVPTSKGLPCTAVQSNIYYYEGGTYGVVTCFSEAEFLKVIASYYQRLGFNPPSTLQEFERSSLPPCPTNTADPAEMTALYNHLLNYHANLSVYRRLLQPEPLSFEIGEAEISLYVSQQYDARHNPTNFEHLAVSKVDIYCQFPFNSPDYPLTNIGLIDTIGLGDVRLGDADRLMKAISEEVDSIVFLRKAKPEGDYWDNLDLAIYNRADEALHSKLPLDKCSMMVFNLDGNNQHCTQVLKGTMAQNGIKVQQVFEIDCRDPQAVAGLLEAVLTYLAENIEELDRQYLRAYEADWAALDDRIKSEIDRVSDLIGGQYGNNDGFLIRSSEDKIKDLYSKIDFLRRSQDNSAGLDPELQSEIDRTIAKCQAIPIPSLDKLRELAIEHTPEAVLRKAIEILRPQILREFHTLDLSLNRCVQQQKLAIAEMLFAWCFDRMTDFEGLELIDRIATNLSSNLPNLQQGFKFLNEFEILYRGLIQSEIYQSTDFPLPAGEEEILPEDFALDKIQAELEDRRSDALVKCRKTLEKLSESLQKASRSMVEEWAAHVTQADGVRTEWRIFLSEHRGSIWPNIGVIDDVQQWLQMLTRIAHNDESLN